MGDTIVEESTSKETYDYVDFESNVTSSGTDGVTINDYACKMENAVSLFYDDRCQPQTWIKKLFLVTLHIFINATMWFLLLKR